MMQRMFSVGFAITLIVIAMTFVHAAETTCTECGMMVTMDSKFTSKITRGDSTLYFCDIGDLFMYLKKKNANDAQAEVRDYTTGEWIDARKAYYVNSNKKFSTPMGWGIAAFKDRSEASKAGAVTDFTGMATAVK